MSSTAAHGARPNRRMLRAVRESGRIVAVDQTLQHRRYRREAPLRVLLAGPSHLHERAAWALEALLARARIRTWELVDAPQQADLAWGSSGAHEAVSLPCDPEAWSFRWDAEPDAHRDPLAASFWWLARVEEQLAPEDAFDEHGRFRFADSALARLDDPLAAPVDEFAAALGEALGRWRTSPVSDEPGWRIVASHDIDLPWRWTRSGRRRALRSIRDDVRRRRPIRAARTLLAVAAATGWRLRRRDPWSNARRIVQLEASHDARSTHYLLAGRHVPEDGDAELHRLGERYARELVHVAGGRPLAGLHGSYTASTVPGRVAEERTRLEQRLGQPVLDHRYHYLRHRPPDAWRELAEAGMRSDASLGYAEQPGFRGGTAHPYRAWDHAAEAPLELVVIPLALMDASFDERYLGIGTGWAGRRLAEQVVDRVRELGGSAALLVHNDRLCSAASPGWTTLYASLLRRVRDAGGVACTAAEAAEAYQELLPAWRRARQPRPATPGTL